MRGDRWSRFRSSSSENCVRFDLMGDPPRFLRTRDRSRDDPERGNAYVVIDLWARRVLDDQTEFVPKGKRPNGNGKG
jgi:hypothetical protein